MSVSVEGGRMVLEPVTPGKLIPASYLARVGVPPKVAQERLGHSTPVFTMKVYTHTLAGMQEQAARAVESYLLGRS